MSEVEFWLNNAEIELDTDLVREVVDVDWSGHDLKV